MSFWAKRSFLPSRVTWILIILFWIWYCEQVQLSLFTQWWGNIQSSNISFDLRLFKCRENGAPSSPKLLWKGVNRAQLAWTDVFWFFYNTICASLLSDLDHNFIYRSVAFCRPKLHAPVAALKRPQTHPHKGDFAHPKSKPTPSL